MKTQCDFGKVYTWPNNRWNITCPLCGPLPHAAAETPEEQVQEAADAHGDTHGWKRRAHRKERG